MDKSRRKFLKLIFIGSGTFIMGKILSPLFSKSFAKSLDRPLAEKERPNFQVVENKKTLSIYDNSGEEILQIDKSS